MPPNRKSRNVSTESDPAIWFDSPSMSAIRTYENNIAEYATQPKW